MDKKIVKCSSNQAEKRGYFEEMNCWCLVEELDFIRVEETGWRSTSRKGFSFLHLSGPVLSS